MRNTRLYVKTQFFLKSLIENSPQPEIELQITASGLPARIVGENCDYLS